MIMGTQAIPIAEVLNSNDKNRFYTIPRYQREYTWNKKQWDTLFNDLIENENGYFLGSIICVPTDNVAMNNYSELEIIDGQQRLTTLSILLISIYNKLLILKKDFEDNEDVYYKFMKLKKQLIGEKGTTKTPRLTPQVQNFNRDDFYSLLCDIKILSGYQKIEKFKNRKIYKAFSCFNSNIDDYIIKQKEDDADKKDYKIIFELAEKVNSAILVSIEVGSNKDAYMLFESLNNRGVPLSAIDLIKNILISKAKDDKEADDSYESWKRIIAYLSEDYNVQERFFRQYYNAFRDELNKPFPVSGKTKWALGNIATRSTILKIYEDLISYHYKEDKNCDKFLEDLEDEAKNYSILINNNPEETPKEFKEPLIALERIQGAPSYILLLNLLSKQKEFDLSNKQLVEIINYLTKFFVRRSVTDRPPTRDLTKMFIDMNVDIAEKKSDEVISKIKATLKNISAADDFFENQLRGPLYDFNADVTRFLLCYYEDQFKTNEIYADLWKRNDNNKYIWTIEHIFPEGEHIPQCWVDMIADGDKKKAREIFDNCVHTLGNLTITGYNSSLSNFSFEKKRDRTNDSGNFIGYKNGLKLNENVVNQEKWTKECIDNRTDYLVKVFLEKYRL